MNKKVVLIVDDEPVNINIVAQILMDNYTVRVANSGELALDIIKQKKPDLILLDVVMPNMDGFEVARRLKADKDIANVPFIFLTGKNDSQSIVDGFKHGAVDYISKPFAKEELLARVYTHLKVDRLQKSLAKSVISLEDKIDEVKKSQKEFETIFNSSVNGIAITDLETNFLLVNSSYSRITGFSHEELLSKSCMGLTVEEDISKSKEHIQRVIDIGYIENIEKKCIGKDKISYVNTSIALMPDKKRLLINLSDITKLKEAQSKITHYLELMDENVISSSTNLDGVIIDVSVAFCKISGYSKDEVIGKKHSIFKHPSMPQKIYNELWNTITNDKVWNGELKNRKKDGTEYWAYLTIIPDYNEQKQRIGYTAIRENITDKKKIEEISIKDELTNLYNRRYFNQIFPDELNRAKRESRDIAFLMLDIDHFKLYNDNYGHQEGDNVLATIGDRLNSISRRSSDFCFRLGGEEFGIIFSEQSLEDAIYFANQTREIIEELAIPHIYSLSNNIITVSIGLIFKDKSIDIDMHKLYKLADDNLYRAKENGRNRVEFGVIQTP